MTRAATVRTARGLVARALLVTFAALALGAPSRAGAQSLRQKISDLFIFGAGQEPLFLAGSADPNNPASLQAHGEHFIPASSAENGALITLIGDALGSSISNIPIGSTSGGESFHFVGGVPVRTSSSAGPIFAERAQTLGRGHVLVGLNRTGFTFATMRGVNMHDVNLTFTHQNSDFPGCDAQYGDDCTKLGVPVLENDVINVRLSMDLDVRVTTAYVTYGVNDKFDVSLVLPFVQVGFAGQSDAQIVPFGGPPVAHYFAGTPTNPVLTATRQSIGSSSGLGDVTIRAKMNVRDTPQANFAVLVEGRFPTGGEEDLLGSGKFAGRAIAVLDSRLGDFSPHVNAGYMHRAGDLQNDAVLGTVGFDQRLSDVFTLAADLISEMQVGDSKMHLPAPVNYDAPYRRTVDPTNIPSMRDDIVNGSFGFKAAPAHNTLVVVNALFPLNRGGLRPNMVYTAALEYTF